MNIHEETQSELARQDLLATEYPSEKEVLTEVSKLLAELIRQDIDGDCELDYETVCDIDRVHLMVCNLLPKYR